MPERDKKRHNRASDVPDLRTDTPDSPLPSQPLRGRLATAARSFADEFIPREGAGATIGNSMAALAPQAASIGVVGNTARTAINSIRNIRHNAPGEALMGGAQIAEQTLREATNAINPLRVTNLTSRAALGGLALSGRVEAASGSNSVNEDFDMPERDKKRRVPTSAQAPVALRDRTAELPNLATDTPDTPLPQEPQRSRIRSGLRALRDELVPREGAGATIGNSLAALGPQAGTIGAVGSVARAGRSAVRDAARFAPGQTVLPTSRGFMGQQQVQQQGRDLMRTFTGRSVRDLVAAPFSRGPLVASAGTLIGADLAREGRVDEPDYAAPSRTSAAAAENAAAVNAAEATTAGNPPAEPARDLQTLMREMEAGRTMTQADFDAAGFDGRGLDVVPAGVSPFGSGAGSLRDLSPGDRARVLQERERMARFEAGDLSAARPGDLRQLRQAFGANTAEQMGVDLRDNRGRFDEMRRQAEMSPEDRQREAALLASARESDARALREGFDTLQDRMRQDRQDNRDFQIAQQDLALRAEQMRAQGQPPRTLDDLFNPETTARIATGLKSQMQSMFGFNIDDEAAGHMVGEFQNFLNRHANELSEALGIPADIEFLANNMQPLLDLFAAGMGASYMSRQGADDATGPAAFFRNALAPAGGRGTRQERGIFNPDNPTETAQNILQLGEGVNAFLAGEDSDRTLRRRRGLGRINEVKLGSDPNNPTQVLRLDNIPQEALLRIQRAYNQLQGLQRN